MRVDVRRGLVVRVAYDLHTPDGAQASATVYSVMETAKANDLNPEKYISHLLTVLPERFAHDPKAQIDDLLPWADELRELCRG